MDCKGTKIKQIFEIQKGELEIGGGKSKVAIKRKGACNLGNNDEFSFFNAVF